MAENEGPLQGQQPPPPPPPPPQHRPQQPPAGPPPQQWGPPQAGQQRPGPPPGPPPGQQPPTGSSGQPPRQGWGPVLVSTLAVLLAAVVTTAFAAGWIWNRADAVTPIEIPKANGTLETVNPSAKPKPTPEPQGAYRDGFLVSHKGDRMPAMPAPTWKGYSRDYMGTRGGATMQMAVHKDSAGKEIWFNGMAFGGINKVVPYKGPATLKVATENQGGLLLNRLYPGKDKPFAVKRRTFTVDGHPAYEITARFPIKNKKVPQEKFSIIAITVIDRGDGTALTALGDFAGTTPGWLVLWRKHVDQIKIAN